MIYNFIRVFSLIFNALCYLLESTCADGMTSSMTNLLLRNCVKFGLDIDMCSYDYGSFRL